MIRSASVPLYGFHGHIPLHRYLYAAFAAHIAFYDYHRFIIGEKKRFDKCNGSFRRQIGNKVPRSFVILIHGFTMAVEVRVLMHGRKVGVVLSFAPSSQIVSSLGCTPQTQRPSNDGASSRRFPGRRRRRPVRGRAYRSQAARGRALPARQEWAAPAHRQSG